MRMKCGYCRFFRPREDSVGVTGRCDLDLPNWLESILDRLPDASRFARTDGGCDLGEDRG